MNQTETVAFWFSFVGSVVGIVLAIIAIAFSILVDRRSSRISEHTIQSLQKIESVVERLSSDTRELIKAAWDKMLGGVDKAQGSESSDSSAKQIAAGIAAELRSELAALSSEKGTQGQGSQQKLDQLEGYLKELEASLMAQLRKATESARPSARFEEVTVLIRDLSARTFALLKAISSAHLTQPEYRQLSAGPLGDSILELRKSGLLVPVVHETGHGGVPCYYMPASIARIARAVLDTLPDPLPSLQRDVAEELEAVGYLPRTSRVAKPRRGGRPTEPRDSEDDHDD